jgi:hypothetical protein
VFFPERCGFPYWKMFGSDEKKFDPCIAEEKKSKCLSTIILKGDIIDFYGS